MGATAQDRSLTTADLALPLFDLGAPGTVHQLVVPGHQRPPLTLNDASGMPWPVWYKLREGMGRAVALGVRRAGWPEMHRVQVGLVWYKGDNGRADADNIAPSLKPAIDALKPANPKKRRPWAAGVIREDHHAVVDATWQRVIPASRDPQGPGHPRLVLVVNEVE